MSTKLKITIVLVLVCAVTSLAIWEQGTSSNLDSTRRAPTGPDIEVEKNTPDVSEKERSSETKNSSPPSSSSDQNQPLPESKISYDDESGTEENQTKQKEDSSDPLQKNDSFREIAKTTYKGGDLDTTKKSVKAIDMEKIKKKTKERLQNVTKQDDVINRNETAQKQNQNNAQTSEKKKEKNSNDSNWPKTYVIQKNDSLWAISQSFYGTGEHWKKIYQANKDVLPNSTTLPVDKKLTIPAISENDQSNTETSTEEPPFEVDNPDRWYKFKKGDQLWNIARKHLGNGSRYREILKLNKDRIDDVHQIREGTWLLLPEKTSDE